MKLQLTIKEIVFIIVILILCYLQFKSCKVEREYREFTQLTELKFKENNAKLFDAEKRIYRGDIIITENNKYIQQLLDTIDHIKKIKSITKVVVETKIDSILVPFEVEVPVHIMPDGSKWLEVPLRFSKVDDWYSISGSVQTHGIVFDSLTYKNDFSITTGTEDHGNWLKNTFKRNNTVVQIKDNNPYSFTKTLHQTVIKSKKRRFHLIAGGGYGLNGTMNVGVYAGYSIISF